MFQGYEIFNMKSLSLSEYSGHRCALIAFCRKRTRSVLASIADACAAQARDTQPIRHLSDHNARMAHKPL
jgi:hypothetical protein